DISDIKINDIKVGTSKDAIYTKIGNEIKAKYGDAILRQDYLIEGLDNLLENNLIHMTGSVSVIAQGDYLVGGFVLQINENDSTTSPISPDPNSNPGAKFDITKTTIEGINNKTTIDEVKQKVEAEIKKNVTNGVTFGRDYTIAGNPQKDTNIQIQSTSFSHWITGGFTIKIEPIIKKDISDIKINNIKVGTSKDAFYTKVGDEIKAKYDGATLGQDYLIEGLDNLLGNNLIHMTGSVSVIAQGDYLVGGFVLQINENDSTTSPISPDPNPNPGAKFDITKITIEGINNKTAIDEVKQRVEAKIQENVSNGVTFGRDYTIAGNPEKDTKIQIQSTSFSHWITGGFTIKVEPIIKKDISDIK
ncbi:hypothetical protein, partial [Williamsoniiplasma luminosum]